MTKIFRSWENNMDEPWVVHDLTGLKCPLMSIMLERKIAEKADLYIQVISDAALAEIDIPMTLKKCGYVVVDHWGQKPQYFRAEMSDFPKVDASHGCDS